MGIDDNTRRCLWNERRIAIHYPWDRYGDKTTDSRSLDPNDYSGSAQRAVRTLAALAQNGGYVCGEHYGRTSSMLGSITPGSTIELFRGKWGNRYKGRTAILKTPAEDVKLVDPLEYAVLAVDRPRQGTIMRWHLGKKTVQNLVESRRSKPQLSDLSPRQQEILCSEFLRLPDSKSRGLPRLAHLLLPTGRTMRDIDIIGIDMNGKRVIAQVTFGDQNAVKWKIDRLQRYHAPGRARLLLFCDCKRRVEDRGVTIFPIGEAYRIFTGTSSGKRWLARSA
jgi:hypothetical protein